MSEPLSEALREKLADGEPSGRIDVSDWCVEWSPERVTVRNDDWRTTLRPADAGTLPVVIQLARAERERTGWWAELTDDTTEYLLAVELRVDGRHRLELTAPLDAAAVAGLGRLDTTGFQVDDRELLGLLAALRRCGARLLIDDGHWTMGRAHLPTPDTPPRQVVPVELPWNLKRATPVSGDEAGRLLFEAERLGRRLVPGTVVSLTERHLPVPFFVAIDAATERHVCMARDSTGRLCLLDTDAGFARLLEDLSLRVQAATCSRLAVLVRRYHRPGFKILNRLEDIPVPDVDEVPGLDAWEERVVEPTVEARGRFVELTVWAYDPWDDAVDEIVVGEALDQSIVVHSTRRMRFARQ